MLETLAHTPVKILQKKKYILVTLYIPDSTLAHTIDIKKFPEGWQQTNIHYFTRKAGDNFLTDGKKLLLKAPSILVPEEFNYVINPLHPGIKEIKILKQRELSFDNRLLRAF